MTHELIERYIYDVTRRLPEEEREDIRRELEASIADMLPDRPGEEEILAALTELGAPRILADRYRQKVRYLISPGMYELYISVMKTVPAIVAAAFACMSALTKAASPTLREILSAALGGAFEGALQAVFWVTLGFALADRCWEKKPWTVADLPQLPDARGVRIPRSSTIVGMILTAFFTLLAVYMAVSGRWFLIWASGTRVINPFSEAALLRSVPYVLALGGMGLVMGLLKLIWARWNLALCVANAVHNIAWAGIVIVMLQWRDLFSAELLALAEPLPLGAIALPLSTLCAVGAAIDIGVGVYKTWKGARMGD